MNGRMLLALVLVTASALPVFSDELCESRFPQLRDEIRRSGTDVELSRSVATELAHEVQVERQRWDAQVASIRSLLTDADASVGLQRLDAVNREISEAFKRLEDSLNLERSVDESASTTLLDCGPGDESPRWPIRSVASTIDGPPSHHHPRHRPMKSEGLRGPPHPLPVTKMAAGEDPTPYDHDAPIQASVMEKAAELNHDPVAIYDWVLREIRPDHAFGLFRSPAATLRAGRGSDADQAALLAALLRASGFPARLVWGVVEIPWPTLADHLEVSGFAEAEAVLTASRVPWAPVLQAGQPVAYEIERVWCEVWLPFGNYRGAILDLTSPTWVALDPHLDSPQDIDPTTVLDDLGFDVMAFREAHLDGSLCSGSTPVDFTCPMPRESLISQVDQYLASGGSSDTYASLTTEPLTDTPPLPVLPTAMPGRVVATNWIGLELPAEATHRARIEATALDGTRLMSADLGVADLSGLEAVVWFEPATEADQTVADAFGSLWDAPPFLIDAMPTVATNEGVAAVGDQGFGMGRAFDLSVQLTAPTGESVAFSNGGILGAPVALSFTPSRAGAASDGARSVTGLLAKIADGHRDASVTFEDEVARLMGVRTPRPFAASTWAGLEVEALGALGLIQELRMLGLYVDADVHSTRPVADSSDTLRDFAVLTRHQASALERRAFEDVGVTAVSADAALAFVEMTGGSVLEVSAANVGAVLAGLPYDDPILSEIEAWALAGGSASVPADALAMRQWEGVGYLLDRSSGESRYQLAGGLSGGSTTAPMDEIEDAFDLDLWPPSDRPFNPDPNSAVRMEAIVDELPLKGTVGEILPTVIRVRLYDEDDVPVEGVLVEFSLFDDIGAFVYPDGGEATTAFALTNQRGDATIRLRLGEDTSQYPYLAKENPADPKHSQALFHTIKASATLAGDLGGTRVLEPVTDLWALGFPGEPVVFVRSDEPHSTGVDVVGSWVDNLFVEARDAHGNSVSNVLVEFSVLPETPQDDHCVNKLPPDRRQNGKVFDISDRATGCGQYPTLETCGEPTLQHYTTHLGASAGLLLGNYRARYYFQAATVGFDPVHAWYSTEGWEDEGDRCEYVLGTIISWVFETDGVHNLDGAKISTAFGPGLSFWLKARELEPRDDAQPGEPPYYTGGGAFVPVCATGLDLTAVSGVAGPVYPNGVNTGEYQATFVVGPDPMSITVRELGNASYSSCDSRKPALQPFTPTVHELTAVSPVITAVDVPPGGIELDTAGRLAHDVIVHYTVEPAEYHASRIELELRNQSTGQSWFLPTTARHGSGKSVVPRGMELDVEHAYTLFLHLNRGSQIAMVSDPEPFPLNQKIFARVSEFSSASLEVDVLEQDPCPILGQVEFELTQAAEVTVTAAPIQGFGEDGAPDLGPATTLLQSQQLAEGLHGYTLAVDGSGLGEWILTHGDWMLLFSAVSSTTGAEDAATGRARLSYSIRDSLPIGHAFAEGVDLWDGHLVLQRSDIEIPGRGVPLTFTRSYSSSSSEPGSLGIGWSHNWESRIIDGDCGVIVIGAEGSGSRFSSNGDGTYTPARGFHSRLTRQDANTFLLDTPGGNRYRYVRGDEIVPVFLLDEIRDPSGNTTHLSYRQGWNRQPIVSEVMEAGGRRLQFSYETTSLGAWRGDLLTRVAAPGGVHVAFEYDRFGHMIRASREEGVRIERYDYAPLEGFSPSRRFMTAVIDELSSATTSYVYTLGTMGVGSTPLPWGLVASVARPEGGTTRFFYDVEALATRPEIHTTWVRDPRAPPGGAAPSHGNPGPFDTTYSLSWYGNPLTITDPLGNTTATEWDLEHVVMTGRTDARGAVTAYEYDEFANLTREEVTVTDVDGDEHTAVVANTYHPPAAFADAYITNRLATRTDRNGAVTTFEYDDAGRLTHTFIDVSDADSAVPSNRIETFHTYDPNTGDRLTTTDPRGFQTFFGYDLWGNLTSITRTLEGDGIPSTDVTTTTLWDVLGRPYAQFDPYHRRTDFEYDRLHRLTATTHPEVMVEDGRYGRPVERVVYDDVNLTVTEIDPLQHQTVTQLDREGRPIRITDREGAEKVFEYLANGAKRLESSWFDGSTPRHDTIFNYDEAGRLIERHEPEGRLSTYGYDANGNLTRETLSSTWDGAFGPRVVQHGHDELNRVIRVTRDPEGLAASREFLLDGEGRQIRVTDPEGRRTFQDFDELGRLIRITGPEWRPGRPLTEARFYDQAGNLVRSVLSNQQLLSGGVWQDADQERSFGYDSFGRTILRVDGEGHETTYRHDLLGNLTEEHGPDGQFTSHEYDALSRRTETTVHWQDGVTGDARSATTRFILDANGRAIADVWPNTNRIEREFDAEGRLLIARDAVGQLTRRAYDARGLVASESDGEGRTTEFVHDALGRQRLVRRPGDRVTERWFDVAGNVVRERMPMGQEYRFAHDALNRRVEITTPEVTLFDGSKATYSETFTHDLVGNQLTATDRRGSTTSFVVDDLNRVVEVHAPPVTPAGGGSPVTYPPTVTTYDAAGNPVRQVDPRGIASRTEYDLENRPLREYRDGVRILSTTYDDTGRPTLTVDAEGRQVSRGYDARNLETSVSTWPEPGVELTSTYRHDVVGDLVATIDPEGIMTTTEFDLRRRQASTTNGEAETTRFGYDDSDLLRVTIRPKGGEWERFYDQAGRLERVENPFDEAWTQRYDANDRVVEIRDPKEQVAHLGYDELDRLVLRGVPGAPPARFGYDSNGNPQRIEDHEGRLVVADYDELNRERRRLYQSPSAEIPDPLVSLDFHYDENSNLVQVDESFTSGLRSTVRTFDRFDRLEGVIDAYGRTIGYGYDLNGNRTSLTDPDGEVTGYSYDGANRLDTISLPGTAPVVDYAWRPNGLLASVTLPSGLTTSWSYDDAYRVTGIRHEDAAQELVAGYAYGYDRNGNRAWQEETNGVELERTDYFYDVADRLWRVAYPDRTVSYTFDRVGNRTSEEHLSPDGATTMVDRFYHYDQRHRLTRIDDRLAPDQTITYGWDANGNQVSRSQAGTTLTFVPDQRNQVVRVLSDGLELSTASYDYQGLRIAKRGADGLIRYTYDGQSVLQQHSAIGDTVATYRWGAGQLLALDHFADGRSYYHLDALGSVAALSDPTGAAVSRYQYDAWGNIRTSSGDNWNPFGFTGYEKDDETDLYYAKARYYDPETARFLSQDPVQGDLTNPPSLHRYLYAYGNPTVWVDPLGREPELKKIAEKALGLSEDPEAISDWIQNDLDPYLSQFGLKSELDRVDPALMAAILQRAGAGVEAANTAINLIVILSAGEEGFAGLPPEFQEELRSQTKGFVEFADSVGALVDGVDDAVAWAVENPEEMKAFLVDKMRQGRSAAVDLVERAASGDSEARFKIKRFLYGTAIDVGLVLTGEGALEGAASGGKAVRGGSWLDDIFGRRRPRHVELPSKREAPEAKRLPAPRSVGELLNAKGRIPTFREGFNAWWDDLSSTELDALIDAGHYGTLAARMRGERGMHEFLQVAEMRRLKEWRVSMDDVHRITVGTEEMRWINPVTGQRGGHRIVDEMTGQVTAPGSKTFHEAQRGLIQKCGSLDEYLSKLDELMDIWQVQPRPPS
jgi:RHS repeat-associated protein